MTYIVFHQLSQAEIIQIVDLMITGVDSRLKDKDMGIEQTMIEGRRVTDEQTLKIVTMVYAGNIQ